MRARGAHAVARARPAEWAPATTGRLFELHRQTMTLDQLVCVAWAGVAAGAPIACPICGDTMESRGTQTNVVYGRCRSCGSSLS